jgi:hypothetical protein
MDDGETAMDDSEGDAAMEAFSLLAHDIRLDILRAFFDHWRSVHSDTDDAGQARPLSYSELMRAVGMQDSGKFNYHLEKLRGVYVENVADGYVPTASATALYRAVIANQPTTRTDFDVEMDCPACESTVTGQYTREFLVVECPDCEEWRGLRYPFPKNGLDDHSGQDLLDAVRERAHYHIGLAQTGQCPRCAGSIDVTFDRDRLDGKSYPTVELVCSTCSWLADIDVLTPLSFVPRAIAVFSELGLYDAEAGEPEDAMTSVTGRVHSEEPFQVALALEAEEGAATVVVDETLDVVSVEVDE